MKLTHKSIKNSFFNTFSLGWMIVLRMVSTPYIVHKLGVDAYGILIVVYSLAGYYFLLDLGLGLAIVKYVSEYYSQKKYDLVSKTISSVLITFFGIGLMGMVCIFLLTNWFVLKVFKIPEELIQVTKFAFHLAAVGFFINMLSNVFSAVPKALQRFDIFSKINILVATISISMTVILLYCGYGLRGVLWVRFFRGLITLIIFIICVKKLIPQMKISIAFNWHFYKRIFSFGLFSLISRISSMTIRQLDKLIIGAVIGPFALTFYAIPRRLISTIKDFMARVIEFFLPVASEFASQGKMERIKKIYIKVSRIAFSLNLAIFLPIILFSYNILYFWMGKNFADNGWIIMMLVGSGALIISCMGTTSLMNSGFGKQNVNAFFSFLTVIINIGLIYPLLKYFGINGAALAMLLSAIQIPFAIMYSNKKVINISNIVFFKKVFIKPIGAAIVQVLVIELLLKKFVANIWTFIPIFLFSFILFFIFAGIIGVFHKDEKELIINFIRSKIYFKKRS